MSSRLAAARATKAIIITDAWGAQKQIVWLLAIDCIEFRVPLASLEERMVKPLRECTRGTIAERRHGMANAIVLHRQLLRELNNCWSTFFLYVASLVLVVVASSKGISASSVMPSSTATATPVSFTSPAPMPVSFTSPATTTAHSENSNPATMTMRRRVDLATTYMKVAIMATSTVSRSTSKAPPASSVVTPSPMSAARPLPIMVPVTTYSRNQSAKPATMPITSGTPHRVSPTYTTTATAQGKIATQESHSGRSTSSPVVAIVLCIFIIAIIGTVVSRTMWVQRHETTQKPATEPAADPGNPAPRSLDNMTENSAYGHVECSSVSGDVLETTSDVIVMTTSSAYGIAEACTGEVMHNITASDDYDYINSPEQLSRTIA